MTTATPTRKDTTMTDKHFSPTDYGFRWTEDWYEYDGKPAEQAARRARDQEAKEMKKAGHGIKKYSLGKQLVSKGGIGSGRPHIELSVPVYGLLIF